MATTTNYSWSTPDDTDLVKDGAAAIRSLGTAIDSTVFTNAGNAIAKTIVDAKGDLIVGTAADTLARLASSGTNGDRLVVDTSTATGLKWETPTGLTYAQNYVSTNQSTSSTSYTDLATTQSVTLTTGTNALVMIAMDGYSSGLSYAKAAVAVSGATTVAASDNYSWSGGYNGISYRYSSFYTYTGLTAGSNTFTLKFRAFSLTANFSLRSLIVIDLGS